MFDPGKTVTVHHERPWIFGSKITMPGLVRSWDGRTLILSRKFDRVGDRYDGIHAHKRAGDHGTIELVRGGWVVRRRYCRRDGSVIGELFNINLPTRFEPNAARYVDLEVDVAYLPGRARRAEIQGEAQLAQTTANGYITPSVAMAARWVAHTLADRLMIWDGRSPLDWDVRPSSGHAASQGDFHLPG